MSVPVSLCVSIRCVCVCVCTCIHVCVRFVCVWAGVDLGKGTVETLPPTRTPFVNNLGIIP